MGIGGSPGEGQHNPMLLAELQTCNSGKHLRHKMLAQPAVPSKNRQAPGGIRQLLTPVMCSTPPLTTSESSSSSTSSKSSSESSTTTALRRFLLPLPPAPLPPPGVLGLARAGLFLAAGLGLALCR